MSIKKYLLGVGSLLAVLGAVLLNTRPDSVPLYVLIIPFVCIFGLVSLTAYTLLYRLGKRRHSVELTVFSLLAGAVTALSFGLNSVGSLLPREIAIAAVFFVVLVLYFFKRRR